MLGCPFRRRILEPHSPRPLDEKKRRGGLRVSTLVSYCGHAMAMQWQRRRNGNRSLRVAVLYEVHLRHAVLWSTLPWCAAVSPGPSASYERHSEIVGGLVIASADALVRLGSLCPVRASQILII
jgi:hypothetical protein